MPALLWKSRSAMFYCGKAKPSIPKNSVWTFWHPLKGAAEEFAGWQLHRAIMFKWQHVWWRPQPSHRMSAISAVQPKQQGWHGENSKSLLNHSVAVVSTWTCHRDLRSNKFHNWIIAQQKSWLSLEESKGTLINSNDGCVPVTVSWDTK